MPKESVLWDEYIIRFYITKNFSLFDIYPKDIMGLGTIKYLTKYTVLQTFFIKNEVYNARTNITMEADWIKYMERIYDD